MPKSNCFVAKIGAEEKTPLEITRKLLNKEEGVLKSGAAMTVKLERMIFTEDEEPNWKGGKNEFALMTEHHFGGSPSIQAFHMVRTGVSDFPYYPGAIEAPVIYGTEDYDGKSLLHIRFNVIEVDVLSDESIASFAELVRGIGTLFPVIAPFAPVLKSASEIILKLVDGWDENDEILGSAHAIELLPLTNLNQNLLQKGRFVMFRKRMDNAGMYLSPDNLVVNESGEEFTECSYVIFSIIDKFIPAAGYDVLEAKASKLISQITNPRSFNTYDHLMKTVELAEIGRKLDRRLDILKKEEGDRTDEEIEVLRRIEEDETMAKYI